MLNTLRHDPEHHVVDACASASTPAGLLEALVPLLRTTLDADASVVSATDPDTTVLASAAVVDNLPETLCAPWFHNEFLVDDVNRFADLHRLGGPPATIHGATRGQPVRSPRFRDRTSRTSPPPRSPGWIGRARRWPTRCVGWWPRQCGRGRCAGVRRGRSRGSGGARAGG
ncbi:MAG: hypothetical protein ACQERF_10620 [Actinomycetota bacterium]